MSVRERVSALIRVAMSRAGCVPQPPHTNYFCEQTITLQNMLVMACKRVDYIISLLPLSLSSPPLPCSINMDGDPPPTEVNNNSPETEMG